MTQDLPWLEEELAAHSHWVRRLARSLVHDETAAEDLVQDTWVAALRKPPSDRRALRSWLGRVVRTLAWKQQRKASTAPLSADEGSLPAGASDMELVERLELHRVLAEELRAIREPVRTTLLQRYIEGMSAAEIAERTSVPAPTVRWRLQQGLEELRTRLDARFGGKRDTWMSALAFALPSKGLVLGGAGTALGKSAAALGGSGLAIGEGVLMSTLVKVSLGAALLVAAVMLALPFVAKDDATTQAQAPLANSGALSSSSRESKPEALSADDPEHRDARERVAGSSSRTELPLGSSRIRFVARIVDENLKPLAGGWLRVEAPQPNEAKADASGSVTLELEAPDAATHSFTCRAGAPERVEFKGPATCERARTTYLGDLVLALGATVLGRIEDPETPELEGIEVLAVDEGHVENVSLSPGIPPGRWPQPGAESARGRVSAGGTFELHGVAPGTMRIWAQTKALRWLCSPIVSLESGAISRDVVVTAQPEQGASSRILGVVLDPDGKPMPEVRLRATSLGMGSLQATSDAEGHFQFEVGSQGPFNLFADAPRKLTEKLGPHLMLCGVVPGPQLRTLQFERTRWIRLEVFGAGKPVPLANVMIHQGNGRTSPRRELAVPGEGDNVQLVLAPSDEFTLEVQARGFKRAEYGPFGPRNLPENLRADLEALPGLRGIVLADGHPVADAKVGLCRVLKPDEEARIGPYLALVDVDWNPLSTDAEGRFNIGIGERDAYHIQVDADGFARGDVGPLELDPQGELKDLEIRLDRGGSLEGRVLVAPGAAPAGTIVSMNRGDGSPRTQRVGPDGIFRFERLTPGNWELHHSKVEMSDKLTVSIAGGVSTHAHLSPNCVISLGQTTHQDLDIQDEQPCVLQGTILIDGSPAVGWIVELWGKQDQSLVNGSLPRASTGPAGQFGLSTDDPGTWRVNLRSPADGSPALSLEASVELKPGANEWSPRFAKAGLTGHLLSTHTGTLGYRSAPEGFLSAKGGIKVADDGSFALPVIVAGSGEIVEYVLGSPETRVLATFTAVAGQTTHVEIP